LLGKPASEKQIALSSILGILYPLCLKWNLLVDDVIAHKYLSVANPGEGLGEPTPPPPPPVFLPKLRPEGPKKDFLETAPPFYKGLDDPCPPSISRSGSGTVYIIKEMRGDCVTAGYIVHFVYKHANYAT